MELSAKTVNRLREIAGLVPEVISTHSSRGKGSQYYDLLSKLHLLAVKAGMKRAYYDSVKLPNPQDTPFPDALPTDQRLLDNETRQDIATLERLKTTAERLGMKFYSSTSSRLDFSDTNAVPDDIVKEMSKTVITSMDVWVYSDDSVLSDIKKVESGLMRNGDLLGYPTCCVDWMAAVKTGFLELCYEYYLKNNSSSDRAAMMKFLRLNIERVPPEEAAEMYRKVSIHVAMTNQKLPFVVHHACGKCIDNPQTPSSKLNKEYGDLARAISPKLYSTIIEESKKYVYNITSDWPSGPLVY